MMIFASTMLWVVVCSIHFTGSFGEGVQVGVDTGKTEDFFEDCINAGEKKEGTCFTKPTNKMKNALNKCKCQIYKDFGGKGPEVINGKRKKCSMPAQSLPTPIKEFLMMIPDFRVKMCFWQNMGLVIDKHINYENFLKFIDMFDSDPKIKEELKGNITACNTMDPLPEVAYIDRLPGMKEAISLVIAIEDFKKAHCMGMAFGKVCEDVSDYDMDKFVDKILAHVEKLKPDLGTGDGKVGGAVAGGGVKAETGTGVESGAGDVAAGAPGKVPGLPG